MTIINTNYTTLEDAWGSNFDKNVSKKNRRNKKSAAVSSKPDPLCELYSRRLKKAKKPYDNDKYTGDEKYRAYKGRDRALYYKYDDDEFPSLVNPERQKTAFLTVDDELNAMALNTDFDEVFDNSNQCIDVNNLKRVSNSNTTKRNTKKDKKVQFNVVPEDEDDVYLQEAILQEENPYEEMDLSETAQQRYEKIYANVYEETDDEGLDDKVSDLSITTECDDKLLIEEEMRRNAHIQTLRNLLSKQNEFTDERQYLDIILYILSGIILIFMMEQFIQIGMRLKSPY
jgi:hypothetical protein